MEAEAKRRAARDLVNRLIVAADDDDDDDGEKSGEEDDGVVSFLSQLRLLSKHDPDSRHLLADAGAVPVLLRILLSKSSSLSARENASAALLNLSISSAETLMSTPGLLDALAAALRPSAACPPVPQHAAATLYSLLSHEPYRPIIGSKVALLNALVHLLKLPNSPTRTIKDSLKALFGISLYPLNRPAVIAAGGVPTLFNLIIKDGRDGIVEDTTAVIAQVAGVVESVDAFRRVSGVEILVDLVDAATGASARTRENAAAALLNLAIAGGERALGDIREMERAEEVVAELAGNGSSARAKKKAGSLLGLLAGGRRRSQEWYHRVFDDLTTPPASPVTSL